MLQPCQNICRLTHQSHVWRQRMRANMAGQKQRGKRKLRFQKSVYSDFQFKPGKDLLSCKSHNAICIPKSRASNKISSSHTSNRHNKDFLCNFFASTTASEETFPIMKKVSREEPCNCLSCISTNKALDYFMVKSNHN